MLGRILVFLGILLVLALSAALLVPFFVDWTNFRQNFENEASRIIGKKVVVHGAVDARLLPFPSVTLSDVRVGQEGDGEPLVTVARFRMDAELAPLLSGEALIYDMQVDHPRLRLKLNADGTLDWMKTGTPQIAASSIILEQVEVNGAEIIFIDEQTGRTRSAQNVDARLSARTLAGPWKANGTGIVDGEKVRFAFSAATPDAKGAVALKSRILPERLPVTAELDGMIRLVDLKPRYDGRFDLRRRAASDIMEIGAEPPKTAAGPTVSGRFELANDRVRIPAYELKLGDPADPYIVSGEATLDTGRKPEFLLTAAGQQIDMTRFGNGEEGDEAATALTDRIRAMMALLADIPIPQVPGRAELSLPAIVAGDTTIRDIRLAMRPDGKGWLIDQANALLPGRTTIEAKGRLNLMEGQSFDGSLLLASSQPSGFAEWVAGGVPASIRSLKTAGFSANVRLTPELQLFENLEIAMGALSLKGRLERVAARDEQPALSVELAGNGFDLAAVQGLAGLLTGDASPQALFAHKIAAKLSLGAFSAFDMTAGKVDALVSLADGAVKIDRLDIGDLAGASISATGALANLAETPEGTAKVTIKATGESGLFKLMQAKLPAHPALDRLVANAAEFSDLDLTLDLSAGQGDWPWEANLAGTANGTKIVANYAAGKLSLAEPDGMKLELTAENDNVPLLLAQAGISTLPFDVLGNGAISLTVNAEPESEPQASLIFSADGNKMSLEGTTTLKAANFLEGAYQLKVASDDIEPLLLIHGEAIPLMGAGLPLEMEASLYVTPEAIVAENIAGKADRNAFAGNLGLSRKRVPSLLEGDLQLDMADLGWIAEHVFGPIHDMQGELSENPLPVLEERGLETRIKLSAGAFVIGNMPEIANATTRLEHKTGALKLADLAGEIAGGKLNGAIELSNASGSGLFRANIAIADGDLATLLNAAIDRPLATGRADLKLILEASGKTIATMPENASGSGELTLRNLEVANLNQNALASILGEADRIEGEVNAGTVTPFLTRFIGEGTFLAERIDIPFSIAGGVIRARNITGGNEAARISAGAEISLPDKRLDASLRIAFEPGDNGLAGAEPAVTFTAQGLLGDPGTSMEPTEMTNFLALRKFEAERRRVEILQANIMEKQRLRREAALAKARAEERRRQKERAEAQERLMKAYQEILRAKALEDATERARREAEKMLTFPKDGVIDGGELPAPVE